MLNFVYCFDKKYTYQGLLSIYSLLINIESKSDIEIHIIHEDVNFLAKKMKKYSVFKNIKISTYNFIKPNIEFPNLKGTHVSLATYYRLFLRDYIQTSSKNIIYVDADMYFLKSPLLEIKKAINDLEKSKFTIAACLHDYSEETIKRLKLKNKKYFNAGFLIIDFQKFSDIYSNIFITKMEQNFDNIMYWDQDVLNLTFDGELLELNNNLNYPVKADESIQNINQEIISLHYMGNIKPWTLIGLEHESSIFYQSLFRKLTDKKYHIQDDGRSVKNLVHNNFLKLDFLNKKYPINYLIKFVKILITKILKLIKK